MDLKSLNSLPNDIKNTWFNTFSSHKNLGPSRAAKVASTLIKNKYKQKSEKLVSWSNDNMKGMKLVRSGFFFPDFTFEGDISTSDYNKDGKKVSPSVLKTLVEKKAINVVGDVEHELFAKENGLMNQRNEVCPDVDTKGLYMLKEYSFEDNKIKVKLGLNKDHPLYYKYLKLNKQGEFLGLSAEFNNYVEDDEGNVVFAESMDWSVTQTGNQMNPYAKMTIVE